MEQVHIIASLTSSVFSFQKDKVITADELEVKHYIKKPLIFGNTAFPTNIVC